MAVPVQTPYQEYTANGVTTSFAVTFQCNSKDRLKVFINNIEQPAIDWQFSGGNVVFNIPPIDGSVVSIERVTPLKRDTTYSSYDNSFRAETVNNDFDMLWHSAQELELKNKNTYQKFQDLLDGLAAGEVAGLSAEILARIAADEQLQENIHIEELRAYAAEQNISLAMDVEKVRVNSELANRYTKQESYNRTEVDTTFAAYVGGRKAFTTLALAQSATGSLSANTAIEVTNDPTASNNGTYQWNGTTLTKSVYDPITQFKNDADKPNGFLTYNFLNIEMLGSKLATQQTTSYTSTSFTNTNYIKSDGTLGVNDGYRYTAFIKLKKGDVLTANVAVPSGAAAIAIYPAQSIASPIAVIAGTDPYSIKTYSYTATQDCYAVMSTNYNNGMFAPSNFSVQTNIYKQLLTKSDIDVSGGVIAYDDLSTNVVGTETTTYDTYLFFKNTGYIDTNGAVASDPLYRYSDFVKLNIGDVLTAYAAGPSNYSLVTIYPSASFGTPIAVLVGIGAFKTYTYTAAQNCYAVISSRYDTDMYKVAYASVVGAKKFSVLTSRDINVPQLVKTQNAKRKFTTVFEDTFGTQNALWMDANTAWTFNAGFSTTTTNAPLYLNRKFVNDRRVMSAKISLKADSVVEISATRKDLPFNVGSSYFRVSAVENKLLCMSTANGTTVINSLVLTNALVADRDYIVKLELQGDTGKHRFSIIDTLSAIEETLEVDVLYSTTGVQSYFYQFNLVSGSGLALKYFNVEVFNAPQIVFMGDSITAGQGVETNAARYPNLARSALGVDKVSVSAFGGAGIAHLYEFIENELSFISPAYVSVCIGTNGAPTSEQIKRLVQMILNIGAIPIINFIPLMGGTYTRPAETRTVIEANVAAQYQGAAFDIASALNYVVANGRDAALYTDDSHLNAAGQLRMFNRFKMKKSDIFYK